MKKVLMFLVAGSVLSGVAAYAAVARAPTAATPVAPVR
jgi:hypothetical protein